LYIIIVSIITLVIEYGTKLTCIPMLHKFFEVMTTFCCVGNWLVRGALYVVLSSVMFLRLEGIHVATGVLTMITGSAYVSGWFKGGSTKLTVGLTVTSDYTAA
jgi:hypothetical protein